jgi:hypothetical protein
MGIETGVDLARFIETGRFISAALGRDNRSHVGQVGGGPPVPGVLESPPFFITRDVPRRHHPNRRCRTGGEARRSMKGRVNYTSEQLD